MTELNSNKPKGEAPIIRGYTREGQTAAELTLWLNTPKNGETSDKAPDFRGVLLVGQEKINVSAWAYSGGTSVKEATLGKEYPPYLSLSASIKNEDGSYRSENLAGSVRGMFRTTINEEKIDVDGSRGLKVIGELKGLTVLKEGVTVSGNLNSRFAEQETVLDLAGSLGFSAAAVSGFKASMEKDAKRTAAPAI